MYELHSIACDFCSVKSTRNGSKRHFSPLYISQGYKIITLNLSVLFRSRKDLPSLSNFLKKIIVLFLSIRQAHRPTLAQDHAMFSVMWFIRGWSLLAAVTKSIMHRELSWASCVDFLIEFSQPPLEAGDAAMPFL